MFDKYKWMIICEGHHDGAKKEIKHKFKIREGAHHIFGWGWGGRGIFSLMYFIWVFLLQFKILQFKFRLLLITCIGPPYMIGGKNQNHYFPINKTNAHATDTEKVP